MNTDDNASSIALDGDMTISRAAELKASLLAALTQCKSLVLDLAGVVEIDTAGVQLLLFLKATAEASHKELRLVAHSEAVAEIFELLGLAPRFGDPIVIAARGNK